MLKVRGSQLVSDYYVFFPEITLFYIWEKITFLKVQFMYTTWIDPRLS